MGLGRALGGHFALDDPSGYPRSTARPQPHRLRVEGLLQADQSAGVVGCRRQPHTGDLGFAGEHGASQYSCGVDTDRSGGGLRVRGPTACCS